MKKFLKTTRNIITIRPLRKALAHKIVEIKANAKYKNVPQWDGNVKPNTVLICEPHYCHGECLPGWTKYWQDLGYNVDIITRYQNYTENPFCNYKNAPRIFAGRLETLKQWLSDSRIKEYEYIFISTTVIWDPEYKGNHFLDFLGFVPQCKNGCMFIDHAPNIFFKKYSEQTLVAQKRIFALSNLSYIPQLNPHYFGEFEKRTTKTSGKTTFVAIGRMEARNYDCLIDAVRYLRTKNYNFVINIIGSGQFTIPDDLHDNIIHLGRLDYNKMYAQVQNADYIIAGLDPFNEEHKTYLTGCTTGNLQLSFGFNKPLIINELFGHHYELDKSALLYHDNELYSAMETAINMTDTEYKTLLTALDSLASETYQRSLNNLKTAVKSNH